MVSPRPQTPNSASKRRPPRTDPSIHVACADYVSNPEIYSERKAVLTREIQHIFHCLTPICLFRPLGFRSHQRFEGTSDHLLRTSITTCAELLFNVALTTGTEANG